MHLNYRAHQPEMQHSSFRLKIILAFLAFGLTLLNGEALARRAIPLETLAYPVLISLEDKPIGSGFYFSTKESVYLVTARHILFEDAEREPKQWALRGKTISLTSYRPDITELSTNELEVNVDLLSGKGRVKSHQSHDVVAVQIGRRNGAMGHLQTVFAEGVNVRSYAGLMIADGGDIKHFRSVYIGNDAILFGYPSSLGVTEKPQLDIWKPLLRKGVIAGKNNENQTIVLDCPSYPGNSGGPVFEVEQLLAFRRRFSLIGLVSEFVPFYEESIDFRTRRPFFRFSNSGYSVVVPVDKVLELVDH